MQLRSLRLDIVTILALGVIVAGPGSVRPLAAEQPSDVPAWLRVHVGEGDGQIAPVVLQRARALYLKKTKDGVVKNPCYFAMDATRPHLLGNAGRRFYVSAKPTGRFARFRPGTAAVAI